jgi:hypothetical protein
VNWDRIGARERQSARKEAAIATVLVTAAIAILGTWPPADGWPYPPCPWHFLTRTYCPGCGSLRGLAAALHNDLPALPRNNLLTAAVLPFLGYAYISVVSRALFGRWFTAIVLPRRVILGLAIVVVGFGIVRNFVPALAPVPL